MRFSYLDLNDKAIQGGQIYDWTVGLNWYLNPNMKVQLNYIAEHRDTPGVPRGLDQWRRVAGGLRLLSDASRDATGKAGCLTLPIDILENPVTCRVLPCKSTIQVRK